MTRRSIPPAIRMTNQLIATPYGCIEFAGYRDPNGYGRVSAGGVPLLAHRIAWEAANGPIPDGLCVLHVCDNPPCVKVSHLFLGTRTDNNRDMTAKGRNAMTVKTHCPHGHPLSGENLAMRKNGARLFRRCRTCERQSGREHARRKRAQ